MVAILLGLSYQDASVFYLSRIYQLQLLAVQNGTSTPPPSQFPDPPIFSFSVWTSIAWSLSLIISLVCTVIATLLRQWARRHVQITQEPRGARSRARVCELVAQGAEMPQLRRISSVLLGLFHLSVGLFLSGFVSSINDNVVFLVTLAVTSICIALYYFVSVVPLSPHFHISHTPFSSLAWFCWSRFVWLTYTLLYNSSLRLPFIRYRTQQHLWELARARLSWTLRDSKVTIEDLARKRSSSLDISAVSRVFDSLDGHEDMEQFLSAIPGFYNSSEVNKDSSVLEGLSDRILAPAIVSFLDRSLSSNLLAKPKMQRRITICLQAMNTDLLLLQCTFGKSLQTLNSDIFRCVDFVGLALEYLRKDDSDPWVNDLAQCILAVAINRIPLDDGTWIDIVDRYLKPQHAQYLREGHNLRLCNLIYLIRQLKISRLQSSNQFKQGGVWGNVLVEALKFEIRSTAYDLQLELRAILDELRSMAPGGVQPSEMAQSNAGLVLSSIRNAFIPHEGTAAPAITFSSSAGDQGPVLQWLASHTLPLPPLPRPASSVFESGYTVPTYVPLEPPRVVQSPLPRPDITATPSPHPSFDALETPPLPRPIELEGTHARERPSSIHSGITLFRLLRLPFNSRLSPSPTRI
jgi:hypothetical protein